MREVGRFESDDGCRLEIHFEMAPEDWVAICSNCGDEVGFGPAGSLDKAKASLAREGRGTSCCGADRHYQSALPS